MPRTRLGLAAVALLMSAGLPSAGALARSAHVPAGASTVRVVLCTARNARPSARQMTRIQRVVLRRAREGFGIKSARVSRSGASCLSLVLPRTDSRAAVLDGLGRVGYLALTDSGSRPLSSGTRVRLACKTSSRCAPGAIVARTNLGARPPITRVVVPDKYVQRGSARVGSDSGGYPTVTYSLRPRGSRAWCSFTRSHLRRYAAIILDDRVLADPLIEGAICGSQTQIVGLTSKAEAKRIAVYLNFGPLPLGLHVASIGRVSSLS